MEMPLKSVLLFLSSSSSSFSAEMVWGTEIGILQGSRTFPFEKISLFFFFFFSLLVLAFSSSSTSIFIFSYLLLLFLLV